MKATGKDFTEIAELTPAQYSFIVECINRDHREERKAAERSSRRR